MTGGYNAGWTEYVAAVLKKHGASLRSQRQRTGLSHTTVSSWLQGVNPGIDGVRAFAGGFGEDLREALRIAGYGDVHATDPDTAADQLLDALDREELTYEPVWEGITADAYLGAEEMSDNDRRRVQAAMRRVLEADRRRRERGKG